MNIISNNKTKYIDTQFIDRNIFKFKVFILRTNNGSDLKVQMLDENI